MNEEEVQIDLLTLLHYILRKWRSIVIAMLIFAVAANLYSVRKSMLEVDAASDERATSTAQMLDKIKDSLSEDEVEQVEFAYTMYSYNAEIYRDNEQYLENSAVMQLNPNEISTEMLSYQVKREASEEELTNILAMYESALLDEDTCAAVAAVFGEKYANTSVRELITMDDTLRTQCVSGVVAQSINSGILNIQIYALDQDQCEQISDIIKARVQAYTQQLQQTFGQFVVNPVSEQYFVSSNAEINDQKSNAINAASSAYSAMQNASSGLSENQLEYYNLLVKPIEREDNELDGKTTEAVADVPNVQYMNVKFILLGLLAGMFLAVCWHGVIYIMTQTVKDTDEVKVITDLPVFGTVIKSKKNGKYNVLDRWIDSLFAHGCQGENNELLLVRISHEISMLAEQKNIKHLLLISSGNEQEIKENAVILSDELKELGMNVTCADSLISDDTDVLKQLESAEAAVLISQLMKSDRNEIKEAVELCNRCQLEILGNVVVGNNL